MNKNKTSILDEAQKTKRYSKAFWGLGALLLLIVLYFLGQWSSEASKVPTMAEYTQTLEKNIKLSVEEDGEIKNPQDFNLAFLSSGRIESLEVEEGQKIAAGEILAVLDARSLELDIQRAQADVQRIYGQIAQQKAENTNLDFLQSESELNAKKEDAISTRQTTQQKVQESFDLSVVQIETSLYRLQSTLDAVDSIFAFKNSRTFTIEQVFNDSVGYNQAKNDFSTLSRTIETANKTWKSILPTAEYADISRTLWKTKDIAQALSEFLDSTISLFAKGNPSSQVSLSQIQSHQADLSTEKDKIRQEIQNLVVAKKNTENALINQQTQLTSAGNQIKQAEVKIENSQKTTTQKDISKEASLSVSYAQLAQANAQLETARYYLSLATLLSPVDGEVLNIDKEVGEIVSATQPFIKILSNSNFIVEVYVEELDIVKIKIGQAANIRIAALNDQVLIGTTSYISSNATEDDNGVITYLVQLEIENGRDYSIKEKMTASVEFIIDEVAGVIALPVEAIFQNQSGQSAVLLADQTEQIIETGLTDNTFVEIKTGLTATNIDVIKNPLEFIQTNTSEVTTKKLLPEIKEELSSLGFNEKEIKKVESGEMEEALSGRLKELQKEEKGGISSMMKN